MKMLAADVAAKLAQAQLIPLSIPDQVSISEQRCPENVHIYHFKHDCYGYLGRIIIAPDPISQSMMVCQIGDGPEDALFAIKQQILEPIQQGFIGKVEAMCGAVRVSN